MSDIENAAAPIAPEVEALVLAELGKRVKARTDSVKAVFGQRYPAGHKETFRSPLDRRLKLGIVYRSDPDPKWQVVDREALHAHLRTFPGNVVTRHEVIGDEHEVVDILREYAPHLLAEVTVVPEWVVEAALEQSAATGEPAAPGIELRAPSGSLTVRPDVNAGPAIEAMVTAGLFTWDGRPVLPAGDEQAAS